MVSNSGRDHSATEVLRHTTIIVIDEASITMADIIAGMIDGKDRTDAATPVQIIIHHAQEQLLKNNLAPFLRREDVYS